MRTYEAQLGAQVRIDEEKKRRTREDRVRDTRDEPKNTTYHEEID